MDLLQHYQPLVVMAVGLILGAFGMMFRSQVLQLVADKAPASAVETLTAKLVTHDHRLVAMETAMRHLPTAEQMGALTLVVSELRGDVRATNAKLEGLEKAMNTLTHRFDLVDEALKDPR